MSKKVGGIMSLRSKEYVQKVSGACLFPGVSRPRLAKSFTHILGLGLRRRSRRGGGFLLWLGLGRGSLLRGSPAPGRGSGGALLAILPLEFKVPIANGAEDLVKLCHGHDPARLNRETANVGEQIVSTTCKKQPLRE